MKLSEQDVSKIAELSKLQLNSEQLAKITLSLSDLVVFIDQMANVNTDGVMPMAHPLNAAQPLRQDTVTEKDQHELLQILSAEAADDLYWVPAAITSTSKN